ncbi:MAG: hypothetical protein H0V89_01025, partial [Deltaproteobacteria bacterium]|nr:hypothetical protein [Deltaproteobacteria bacterium]
MNRRILIAAALVLGACKGDSPEADDPGSETDSPTGDPAGAPAFVVAPTLAQNTVPEAPLSWRLVGTLDRAATVTVTVTDPIDSWERGPFVVGDDGALDVWLQRWHPGQTHSVVVTATDDAGSVSVELAVVAPALPADMADVRVVTATPDRMEPGFTVFAPSHTGPTAPQYLTAYDENGIPVWWYAAEGSVFS